MKELIRMLVKRLINEPNKLGTFIVLLATLIIVYFMYFLPIAFIKYLISKNN